MPRRTDPTSPVQLENEKDFDQALRPLTFREFVGQKKIVDNLNVFIAAARKRVRS